MQEKNTKNEIYFIIDRLKSYFQVNNDYQLAYKLGVKQNTISGWKKRDTLDHALIISKCKDINLNWVFLGTGDMIYKDVSESYINKDLPPGPCQECKSREKVLNAQADTIAALKKTNELLESLSYNYSEGQKRKNVG